MTRQAQYRCRERDAGLTVQGVVERPRTLPEVTGISYARSEDGRLREQRGRAAHHEATRFHRAFVAE